MKKTNSPFSTKMHDDVRNALLNEQTECTFIWSTREGNGAGTTMSYLWKDDRIWLTTSELRPRVKAVTRNPAVSVVISSSGTTLGSSRGITLKGAARVHELETVADWFLPAYTTKLFPDSEKGALALSNMLAQPGQVVIEVIPEKWICYDGKALMEKLSMIE